MKRVSQNGQKVFPGGNNIDFNVERIKYGTLSKAGLSSNDLERIIFVGGPTNYKPLRDKIAFKLSLHADIDVNPMTAVAEGASIFAESIDWSTDSHNRKPTNKVINTTIDLSFKFTARTPADYAKVMCVLGKSLNSSIDIPQQTKDQEITISIKKIFPSYTITSGNSNKITHVLCEYTDTQGKKNWIYMSVSEYKAYFDSSANPATDQYANERQFYIAKKVTVKTEYVDDLINGASSTIGQNTVYVFSSMN